MPSRYGSVDSESSPAVQIDEDRRAVDSPTSFSADGYEARAADTAPLSSPRDRPILVSPESELDHIGFGMFQGIMLAILGLANASDAVELLALSFILPQLDVDDSSKALLSAAIFVGMLIGGLFFGIAADSMGRKVTLAVSLTINGVFGLASAVAPSTSALFFARAMGGFGVGGSIPGVFTLAAELLPSASRAFWLSTVAWWWMVGAVYAAGFAWVMIGVLALPWQAFAVVATLPALLAAALVALYLPESPRYLHGARRVSEATVVLLRIAKTNGVQPRLGSGWELDPVDFSGDEDRSSPPSSGAVSQDVETAGLLRLGEPADESKPSAKASTVFPKTLRISLSELSSSLEPLRMLFFSPGSGNGTTAVLLAVVWFCLSFGWYGLLLWIPTLLTESGVDLDPYQVRGTRTICVRNAAPKAS